MENRSAVGSDTRRRGRLIVGVAGLVLSAGYLSTALRLSMGTPAQPGPGVFPIVVGCFMIAASLLLLLEQVSKGAQPGALGLPRGENGRRLIGFGFAIALYIVLAGYLGHIIASFAMSLIMVRLIDPRSWRRTLITAAAIALGSYILFVLIFAVPLPAGSLLPAGGLL